MPKFAANLSMLFTELPFLDRFAAAADAGFTAVEYLFPYDYEASAIAILLERHGLKQVLFNMPPGNWQSGERGIAIYPATRDAFRDGVAQAVTYARALNCKQIHCLAGIAPPNADHRTLRLTYVDNLKFAADALAKHDITLLIEPINTRDIPGYYLHTSAQTLDVIESVDAPNLRLQYDIYHMQIMEGDLAPTLARHIGRIGHIQIADTPGRHEPGTGEINFPFLFRHLDDIGYAGWVGCEYHPSGATLESFSWREAIAPTAVG